MTATTCSVFIKYAGSERPVHYQSTSPQATVERWVQRAIAATATPTRTYNIDGLTCDGRAVVVNWSHVDAVYVTDEVIPDVDVVPEVTAIPDVDVVPDIAREPAAAPIPTWLPLAQAGSGADELAAAAAVSAGDFLSSKPVCPRDGARTGPRKPPGS